jgi:hypothetical protein
MRRKQQGVTVISHFTCILHLYTAQNEQQGDDCRHGLCHFDHLRDVSGDGQKLLRELSWYQAMFDLDNARLVATLTCMIAGQGCWARAEGFRTYCAA